MAGNWTPAPPRINPNKPDNRPGKKSAISTKIACCILNLMSLLIPGLPPRKLSTKKAMNPENGIVLYKAYNTASATTKGLDSAPSAPSKNRPYCNPSMRGNRYGRTDKTFSEFEGSCSFKISSFAMARAASCSSSTAIFFASDASLFSSLDSASSLFLNLSTPTNSSSCRTPSPLASNSFMRALTLASDNSVLRTFSSPALSSATLIFPSWLVSNCWNAFSAASAICCAFSASSPAASARSLAAMDLRRSISSS
mmetsp:Transcript_18256/g.26642  ORF Transcript_18256/g.26642 Transcript_18256/m.26642 type:complete len:254 (+) Transcript_18256:325-1086(+)